MANSPFQVRHGLVVNNTVLVANTTTGNVGIGTSNPQYTLDVAGDARITGNLTLGDSSTDTVTVNAANFSLANNVSFDSGTLFIDAQNNRVGVGITNPQHSLSVNGSIHLTTGDGDRIWSGSNNLRLGSYPQLQVSDTLLILGGQQSISFGGTGAYATIASNVPWDFVKGTTPQGIRIYGTFTNVSNYERLNISAGSTAAYIQTENAGTGVARPLYLGANNATAVTIDTAGRVGIGTTSPAYTLDVNGTIESYGSLSTLYSPTGSISPFATPTALRGLRLQNTDNTTNTAVGIDFVAGSSSTATSYIVGIREGSFLGALAFGTRTNVSGDYAEAMRITSAGRVGINTSSPAYRLDVNGAIGFNGDIVKTSGDDFRIIVFGRTVIGGGGSGVQTIRSSSGGLNIIHTDTDGIRLFVSDNVGVGTTSPTAKLHVAGGTSTSNTTSLLNLTQTWNNSGNTFTAIQTNITDTASASTSKLIDLQVAGNTKFKVEKSGDIYIAHSRKIESFPDSYNNYTSIDFGAQGSASMAFYQNGTPATAFRWNDAVPGVRLISTNSLNWTSVGNASASADLAIWRDDSNILAQRFGASAQTFRVYGSYTDSANYERLSFSANSTAAYIQTENAGTGIARSLRLGANNTTAVTISTSSVTLANFFRLNVGTSYSSSIQIADNGYGPRSMFVNSDGQGNPAQFSSFLNGGDGLVIPFVRGAGSASSPASIGSGNSLTDLQFHGYLNSATRHAAGILSSVDTTPSGNILPGRLSFYVFNVAGTKNTPLTIRDGGITGSDNSTTNTLALKNGTAGQTFRIYGTYTDDSNNERLSISANTTGHYIIGEEAGTGLGRPLYLGANNSVAMTIDTSGRVGIGTATPSSKLEVIGNSYLNGAVTTGALKHSPVQISKLLTAFDAADIDVFGAGAGALSGDGSVLAIGAPSWEGTTGTSRGGVYIYDWNGSAWIQRGSILEAPDTADSDNFGIGVSLSSNGSILAVGAYTWEGTTGADRGGVYIFDWNGSAWIQRGSVLEASDAADGDLFGNSVSLSSNGSILAVGAGSWEGATGTNRGGVYIFDWNGSSWVQRGSVLEASDAADSDNFGRVSLSSNGSILAVGAGSWEGATGTGRGGVYIFDWNGSAWIQRGSVLEAADAADSDNFGRVSLSGDGSVLAVGATSWEGTTGTGRGGVYIFDWNGSSWVQRGSVLEASDAADNDNFGSIASLSFDGSVMIVTASNWEGATGTNRGAVYTYTLTGVLPSYTGESTGSGWIEGSNSALIARTAGLDRVTIDSNGNVGIGTTSPTAKLDVAAGISTSNTTSLLNLTQTWNNSGNTFTAIKTNITNTASASDSKLIDLQVGGNTKFSVLSSLGGRTVLNGPNIYFYGYDDPSFAGFNSRISHVSNETIAFVPYNTFIMAMSAVDFNPNAQINKDKSFGWSDTTGISTTGDIRLWRDAAGILAQRNSTSGQTYRVYGTYTDSANYERLSFSANSTAAYIQTENAGTGIARSLRLGANNQTVVSINADKSVGIKQTLTGRSSIDHVTYSIFEAGVDAVYLCNNYNRSGPGYPPDTIYIGGLASDNFSRDLFKISSTNVITTGALFQVVRPAVDPTVMGAGALQISRGIGTNSLGIGTSANDQYAWLQYSLDYVAKNIVLNPVGGNVGIGTTSPATLLQVKSTKYVDSSCISIYTSDGGYWDNATGTVRINPAGSSGLAQLGIMNSAGFDIDWISDSSGTKSATLKFSPNGVVLNGTSGNTSYLGIGTTTPTALLDANTDIIRIRTSKTPASASATGNQGDICWDSNYIYVCTAANTWVRANLSTW